LRLEFLGYFTPGIALKRLTVKAGISLFSDLSACSIAISLLATHSWLTLGSFEALLIERTKFERHP
jgi:hypothetical protein